MAETSTNTARTPLKRLQMMAFVLLGLAFVGVLTMKMTWYHFEFASDVIIPGTYETIPGVSASKDLTGLELPMLDMGNAPMQPEVPTGPLGVMMPLVWLLVAAGVGAGAAFLRSGLVTLGGLVAAYMAHTSLGGVRAAMTYGPGGQYVSEGQGISVFTLVLFLTAAVTVATGVQAMVTNRHEREAKRARGEEVPPTIIEIVAALKLSSVTRVLGAVVEEAGNAKTNAQDASKKKTGV
jgi:hypothetical protein